MRLYNLCIYKFIKKLSLLESTGKFGETLHGHRVDYAPKKLEYKQMPRKSFVKSGSIIKIN